MRYLGLCIAAILFNASLGFSQNMCSTPVQTVSVGTKVQIPMGHSAVSTVRFVRSDGITPPNGDLGAIGEKTWSKEQADALIKMSGGDVTSRLVWTANGVADCFQLLSIVQPPGGTTRTTRSTVTYDENECDVAGADWRRRILANQRSIRVTVLVFNHEGELCSPPPSRPTQGDPIYVGVFTSNPVEWSSARIRFEPCSLEPSTPNILASGSLGDLSKALQSEEFSIREFPVRQCWDSAVTINGTGPEDKQFSYALQQAKRYRATVHLGTVFTENHGDETFALQSTPDGQRIFSQGPVERGPEWVGALVFYSVLKYLPSLAGRPAFPGRDPVADNGIVDKIGAVVGVGLEHPSERFIGGFSFEIAAGVNALGVWEWAQVNKLKGVTEGSIFTGAPSEIPTQKAWEKKFVFGISMDLIYAVNMLKR